MKIIERSLPHAASEYLQKNFPDGFQFDEFYTETDTAGHLKFVVSIIDGTMIHQLEFNPDGMLRKHDIVSAYFDENYDAWADYDEFHEDDN